MIDDDDGCPIGDPDCRGANGDCHDACEPDADAALGFYAADPAVILDFDPAARLYVGGRP